MKLRVPEGCGAVSHQGRLLEINEDGSIDVDEEASMSLAAFGFTPWSAEPSTDIPAKTDDERVKRAIHASLKTMRSIDAEDVCDGRRMAKAAMRADEDEASPSAIATAAAGVQMISALSRQGLFAFLRASGVSVSLPITNDELRAAARRALKNSSSRQA